MKKKLNKATGGNILLGDLVSVFVRLIGFLQPMQVYLLQVLWSIKTRHMVAIGTG